MWYVHEKLCMGNFISKFLFFSTHTNSEYSICYSTNGSVYLIINFSEKWLILVWKIINWFGQSKCCWYTILIQDIATIHHLTDMLPFVSQTLKHYIFITFVPLSMKSFSLDVRKQIKIWKMIWRKKNDEKLVNFFGNESIWAD